MIWVGKTTTVVDYMAEKKRPKRHVRPSRKKLPEWAQNSPVMLDTRGRELTEAEVEAIDIMAQEQCTYTQIAAVFKVHPRTIIDRYSHIIEDSKEAGKRTLMGKLWKKGVHDEDVKVMIWLSKQYLGFKESWPEVPQMMTYNVNIVEVPR